MPRYNAETYANPPSLVNLRWISLARKPSMPVRAIFSGRRCDRLVTRHPVMVRGAASFIDEPSDRDYRSQKIWRSLEASEWSAGHLPTSARSARCATASLDFSVAQQILQYSRSCTTTSGWLPSASATHSLGRDGSRKRAVHDRGHAALERRTWVESDG